MVPVLAVQIALPVSVNTVGVGAAATFTAFVWLVQLPALVAIT